MFVCSVCGLFEGEFVGCAGGSLLLVALLLCWTISCRRKRA